MTKRQPAPIVTELQSEPVAFPPVPWHGATTAQVRNEPSHYTQGERGWRPMMIDLQSNLLGEHVPSTGVPPRTAELLVIRSCNDTWLLDPSRQRFRRIPRNAPVSFLSEVGHWSPYERLEMDPGSDDFTLVLNA